MRILVTTPTGNIGSRIVERLLDTTHDLTLLVRDPAKLSQSVRDRATVVSGTFESADSLRSALRGADAAFLLIPPPSPTVTHWRNWQTAIGESFAAAAAAAGVKRVVFLSSSGAQHDDLSAISGLGAVERILRDALPNVTAIRAAYFMENTLGSLTTVAANGAVYGVIAADVPQQLVATRDIGDIAVRWLTAVDWTGHHIAAAHGPTLLTAAESTAILGEVLGRAVSYVQIPPAALRDALLQAGLPAIMAHGYEEMMGNMATHLAAGDFSDEPQSAESAGTTSFRAFATDVLKPAFDARFAAAA